MFHVERYASTPVGVRNGLLHKKTNARFSRKRTRADGRILSGRPPSFFCVRLRFYREMPENEPLSFGPPSFFRSRSDVAPKSTRSSHSAG